MFAWKPNDLDPDQEEAVRSPGSVFLISCPGSGKTRTLTYKIAYELSRLESPKQRVVAITYTHRAADEIHERIEALGVDTSQLWIGTIHSFCLEWIIKPYSIYHPELKNGYRVINTHDAEQIITQLCEPYRSQNVTFWDCGYYFRKDGYVLTGSETHKHPAVGEILVDYFKTLAAQRQIDFEMMLFYAYQIIEANPIVSSLLAKIFSFIMVDEYQDTKQIQYSIIASILAAGNGATNAFVVGDPNQSIFKNLGGYAIEIDDFERQAGLKMNRLTLWRNYRSSDKIVSYFGYYNLHETKIESVSKHKEYPSSISFNSSIDLAELENEIVRLIRFNIEVKKISPEEICILAPSWISLAPMTRRLVASLPEYEFDGPGMVPFASNLDNFFYKLSRIVLTRPSPDMFIRRCRWAAEAIRDLEGFGAGVGKLSAKQLLKQCNSISIAVTNGLQYLREFFAQLFEAIKVDMNAFPPLIDDYAAFFASSEARIERLMRDGAEFVGTIDNFRKVFGNRGGITISTIHGIKGDEYEAVIAYALLEGMVPHFNDPEQHESAMKLLYVICSRAKKNLHLISERNRPRGRTRVYGPTEKLADYVYEYDTINGR